MRLSEMPLTQQSASEVSRLYLNSKLKMLTSCEDDKQLQGILESLQHEDFYNLTPKEKTKVVYKLKPSLYETIGYQHIQNLNAIFHGVLCRSW